jgi:hypothetical protein
MAIFKLKTRISPYSGSAIFNAASVASTVDLYYDSANIVWPSLMAASGASILSTFDYALPSGVIGKTFVNNAVASIAAAASASTIG